MKLTTRKNLLAALSCSLLAACAALPFSEGAPPTLDVHLKPISLPEFVWVPPALPVREPSMPVLPLPDRSVLAMALLRAAPDAPADAVKTALAAVSCAEQHGNPRRRYLGVIDFDKPSNTPRMWVFDTRAHTVLWREIVAHGKGSGTGLIPTDFSNTEGSLASSLGLYSVAEVYDRPEHQDVAARLDGVDGDLNSNARERGVVLHAGQYVSEHWAGLSEGCPAVRREVIEPLTATLGDKQGWLYAYARTPELREQSKWLAACEPRRTRALRAVASR